jgi:hypothetical protein
VRRRTGDGEALARQLLVLVEGATTVAFGSALLARIDVPGYRQLRATENESVPRRTLGPVAVVDRARLRV